MVSLGVVIVLFIGICFSEIWKKDLSKKEEPEPFVDRFNFRIGDEIKAPSGEVGVITNVFRSSYNRKKTEVGIMVALKGSSDLA